MADVDHVEAGIDSLHASGGVMIEDDDVYLTRLYDAERDVAASMARLLESPGRALGVGAAARVLLPL